MNENREKKTSLKWDIGSRFWKAILIILAAILTFAGPTYMVYVLSNVLEINYVASMLSGLGLFIAGLAVIRYLIKKQVIS